MTSRSPSMGWCFSGMVGTSMGDPGAWLSPPSLPPAPPPPAAPGPPDSPLAPPPPEAPPSVAPSVVPPVVPLGPGGGSAVWTGTDPPPPGARAGSAVRVHPATRTSEQAPTAASRRARAPTTSRPDMATSPRTSCCGRRPHQHAPAAGGTRSVPGALRGQPDLRGGDRGNAERTRAQVGWVGSGPRVPLEVTEVRFHPIRLVLGAAAIASALATGACSSGSPTSASATGRTATPSDASTSSMATSVAQRMSPTTSPTTSAAMSPARTTPPASAASRAGRPTGSVTVLRTLATGLDVPWGLALLPDRSGVLVTTRDDGLVRRIDLSSGHMTLLGQVPGVVSNVVQQGEGGLLGIAVSPRFATDRTVFVYFSTAADNRIARLTYDPTAPAGRQLARPQVIVRGIPHGVHHNGGHLAFGPDGYLWATTGEAGNRPLAQDRSSLGGKILRMTTAGRPAPGNPFGSLVWSYGHRNVEGLAWDAAGRLWSAEFGDHLHDELNLIRRGGNYGWPQTEGKTSVPGIVSPVEQWSPDTNSPSGIAIAAGSAWLAGLRGERLWRVPLDGATPAGAPQAFLDGRYGRLRSVLAVADRTLLVTTSDRDGRA